jgi:hypothetical protein
MKKLEFILFNSWESKIWEKFNILNTLCIRKYNSIADISPKNKEKLITKNSNVFSTK